jgi:mannose/fructose/N-acetylgalactosamine-specific phosphotransferase system component IIC
MKARRSYVNSLWVPLSLCSVFLALVTFAVWSGMYQSTDAAEAIQDVGSLTSFDTTNHLMVAMLWFVPLTLILLVAVWVRHVRSRESEPAR